MARYNTAPGQSGDGDDANGEKVDQETQRKKMRGHRADHEQTGKKSDHMKVVKPSAACSKKFMGYMKGCKID